MVPLRKRMPVQLGYERMARDKGLEPLPAVLETAVQPLTLIPLETVAGIKPA